MLKRYCAIVAAGLALSATPALAQHQGDAAHNKDTRLAKGASVAIEGCVAAGQKKDTYVLGTVREIPGVPVAQGQKRIYWLDPKHLKGHTGHTVLISGIIKDLERSEIEVEMGATEGGGPVAKIEGPGQAEVKTAAGTVGTAGAARTGKEVDIPIVLVKIDVTNVKMVSSTCK